MLIPIFDRWDSKDILAQWSLVGSVYIRLDESNASQELAASKSDLLQQLRVIVGPFTTEKLDQAFTWLDQGVRQIVLNTSYDELVNGIASDIPSSRVYLSITLSDAQLQEKALAELLPLVSSGVFLTAPISEALLQFRNNLPEGYRVVVVDAPSSDLPLLHEKHIDIAIPSPTIQPGFAFAQCAKTDRPDGLFTTVVTDTSGIALGLVYSSTESIAASVSEKRGIYYSRSRGGLWRKGDSSGHVQELKQLDLDCDSDAIRCTVFQHDLGSTTKDNGNFCHLDKRTCWGPSTGIRELQQTLQERLVSAPVGSYTKRLFDDRILLRNKLVEEAQELAEATEPKHVAEETADVLYFALVRAVAAGVSLHDVEIELDQRSRKLSRRPGNAKTYRIEAATSILAQAASKSS